LQGLGLASAAYLNALNYARERLQGTDVGQKVKSSKPVTIINHPDIRRNLLWMKSYLEGLRAFNYYTALSIDKRNAETDEIAKKAIAGLIELLTPICKAYSSDIGYRICEQAIQVYGGYGFCGDYPVEQFSRDCKIASLYEGTNGIQAMDLLGRKMGMAKGAVFKYLLGEIDKTISEASKDGSLSMYVERVKKAKDGLIDASQHLMGLMKGGRIPESFLSATPFLEIVGDTLLGWLHLWQLSIADKKLKGLFDSSNAKTKEDKSELINTNKEVAFYSGKVHTSRFFITKILPLQEAKISTLKIDEFDALNIEDIAFGEGVTP